MTRVALATAEGMADLDDDLVPTLHALDARGVDAHPEVWTDPEVPWADFDAVVIRSTWDYLDDYAGFVDWIERVDAVTRLFNPPALVRWCTDKRYLVEVAAAGVPTVPTVVIDPGDDLALTDRALAAATELVVKPTVSAGSRDTVRHTDRAGALAHAEQLLARRRAVVIQPYLTAVDDAGETGTVWIDGRFSHGFRKGPILTPDEPPTDLPFAVENISARQPTETELAVAAAAMEVIAGAPLYARIDLVPGPDGPLVLEIEAAEPSLFLAVAPEATDTFAAAILARL